MQVPDPNIDQNDDTIEGYNGDGDQLPTESPDGESDPEALLRDLEGLTLEEAVAAAAQSGYPVEGGMGESSTLQFNTGNTGGSGSDVDDYDPRQERPQSY